MDSTENSVHSGNQINLENSMKDLLEKVKYLKRKKE
jgi:hypothetical protein